jgi:hypothetical protein
MTRRRRQPEAALQKCVVDHLRIRPAPNSVAFAVPNGGYRRPIEAAILKSMGTLAGVPDICCIREGRTFFLELKAAGGRLSPTQVAAHSLLASAGAQVAVADNIDAALKQLESWRLLRGTVARALTFRTTCRNRRMTIFRTESRGGADITNRRKVF